jgi:hypothetical protein
MKKAACFFNITQTQIYDFHSHGLRAIPFNVHTPPTDEFFWRVTQKVVSDGLSLSASFDLCDFSEG